MNADRLMRNMMQSMGMGMPFGGGMFDDFVDQGAGNQSRGYPAPNPFNAMMPHGFMNPMSMMMMDPFQSMQQAMTMATNVPSNSGFSYCSSSVTTYTTDEHGRPQVYQQSNEVKQGPGGVKETKSAIRDSKSGHQELSIGHHLHDKARIKKKSKNVYTGDEEQAEDLVNLDEEEAEAFERNWQRQARDVGTYNQIGYSHGAGPSRNRLALTNGTSSARSDAEPYHTTRANDKALKKEKKKKKSKEERHK